MLRNTRDRVSSFARKTCHHSIGMIDRIIFATVLLPLLVASLADWQGSFRRSSISISFAWSGLDWLANWQATTNDRSMHNINCVLGIIAEYWVHLCKTPPLDQLRLINMTTWTDTTSVIQPRAEPLAGLGGEKTLWWRRLIKRQAQWLVDWQW